MNSETVDQDDESMTQDTSSIGYVYILASGRENVFKIGRTKGSVEKRIKALNTGNPSPLVLFDIIETPEPSVCEMYLHQLLRTSRFREGGGTEFFTSTPDHLREVLRKTREFLSEYIPAMHDVELLSKLESEDKVVEPTPELLADFEELMQVRAELDMLKFKREMIECRIKIAMGRASEMRSVAKWKSISKDSLDQPKFREEQPELFAELLDRYKKTTISRTFTPVKN